MHNKNPDAEDLISSIQSLCEPPSNISQLSSLLEDASLLCNDVETESETNNSRSIDSLRKTIGEITSEVDSLVDCLFRSSLGASAAHYPSIPPPFDVWFGSQRFGRWGNAAPIKIDSDTLSTILSIYPDKFHEEIIPMFFSYDQAKKYAHTYVPLFIKNALNSKKDEDYTKKINYISKFLFTLQDKTLFEQNESLPCAYIQPGSPKFDQLITLMVETFPDISEKQIENIKSKFLCRYPTQCIQLCESLKSPIWKQLFNLHPRNIPLIYDALVKSAQHFTLLKYNTNESKDIEKSLLTLEISPFKKLPDRPKSSL